MCAGQGRDGGQDGRRKMYPGVQPVCGPESVQVSLSFVLLPCYNRKLTNRFLLKMNCVKQLTASTNEQHGMCKLRG